MEFNFGLNVKKVMEKNEEIFYSWKYYLNAKQISKKLKKEEKKLI